jgi:putative hemolysin
MSQTPSAGQPAVSGPFSVRSRVTTRWPPLARAAVAPIVDRALGLTRLNRLYASVPPAQRASVPFWTLALDELGVVVDVQAGDLDAVPRTGPVVVASNHPFGGLDGLAVLAALHRVRSDVRVVANEWLREIPELRASIIPVDVFGGRAARARNAVALRQGLRWLKQGGVLAVFPAGEVSRWSLREGAVVDGPWQPAAARLAQSTGAPIVPVHVHGANTALFHAAGLVHPLLRTLLLPREVLRRRACALRLSVGSPISAGVVSRYECPDVLIRYARARSGVLAGRVVSRDRRRLQAASRPLVAAPSDAELRREIESLPAELRLAESSGFSVWLTDRDRSPRVVEEVGRLRELSFRAVGEGTGLPTDLDRFDDYYHHLVVWRDRSDEVVGAYRLGPTDAIVGRLGAGGLYTHTLFDLGPAFLAEIEPALELGRSFVRPEYQRGFAPLMLLWKGIGRFVAAQPRYARLFGAVSISRDYSAFSRQLLMTFLLHSVPSTHRSTVVPRRPPRDAGRAARFAALGEDAGWEPNRIDELVREAERGERGMPVLLRQYLKLEAEVVGFSVDPGFADALDALMLVDLRRVAPPTLQRYMGPDGAARFLDRREPQAPAGRRSPMPAPAAPEPAVA